MKSLLNVNDFELFYTKNPRLNTKVNLTQRDFTQVTMLQL